METTLASAPSSAVIDNNKSSRRPGAADSYTAKSHRARRLSSGYEELPGVERISSSSTQQGTVDEHFGFWRRCMQRVEEWQAAVEKLERDQDVQQTSQLAEKLGCADLQLQRATRLLRLAEEAAQLSLDKVEAEEMQATLRQEVVERYCGNWWRCVQRVEVLSEEAPQREERLRLASGALREAEGWFCGSWEWAQAYIPESKGVGWSDFIDFGVVRLQRAQETADFSHKYRQEMTRLMEAAQKDVEGLEQAQTVQQTPQLAEELGWAYKNLKSARQLLLQAKEMSLKDRQILGKARKNAKETWDRAQAGQQESKAKSKSREERNVALARERETPATKLWRLAREVVGAV